MVLLIQIVAALLLLLGSGLIFQALVELDAPSWPRPAARPRSRAPEGRDDLRRAA